MTEVATAPPERRAARWLPVLAVAAVAVLRLVRLDADPPTSMPDPTIMDEGLWADAARGKAWFAEGWFADDLGNAWLVAPLYSWLLLGIYELFGVGLWQTRLLSALGGIGTAAIAAMVVGRRCGPRYGALAAMLVGLCPLLDYHARFALLETTQGMFLLLSFALLFAVRPTAPTAFGAGVAMAAAMLVKPNSATFGVLPFALAFAVEWRDDARQHGPSVPRRHLARAVACLLGGSLTLLAIGLPVWLPHWSEFTATLQYESGGANWHLGDHLLRLGIAFARENTAGSQRLWSVLRHAPLLAAGVWLLLLRRSGGTPLPEWTAMRPLWLWLAVGLLVQETSYDHVARRLVLLLPAAAILCSILAAERRSAPPATTARPWPLAVRWLLLLLPAAVAIKPAVANAFSALPAPLQFDLGGNAPSHLGGWCVLLALAASSLVLGRTSAPDRWLRLARRLSPALLTAAAAFELASLAALPPHRYTVLDAQRHLAPLVEPGNIVLGEHASMLFQAQRVRTVRRIVAGMAYSTPRPNPDVAERLQPRYVVDYKDPKLRRLADVTANGFDVIGEVGLLREASGKHRFELQLWRRR